MELISRFLLSFGVFVSFLISSSNVMATSNHTINVDGSISDWAADEMFNMTTGGGNAYFTWDADYIYFAVSHSEANYDKLTTFLYFDTDPSGSSGTTNAYSWSGSVTTPFKCDYVLVWKNEIGHDYIEVRKWDGSSWSSQASNTASSLNTNDINFYYGTNCREVRIKRSLIGSPEIISVCSYTEQQWGNFYRYFGWPSTGWTDGNRSSSTIFTHYRAFSMVAGIAPNTGSDDSVLPVELTGFTAAVSGKMVSLKWNTATEENNAGFDIERKAGAEGQWGKIGFVAGNGTCNNAHSYSYTDNSTLNGKYFYRLKQIDNNGQFKYSGETEASVNALPGGFVMEQNYPNPFNPSTTIKFGFDKPSNASLTVYDQLGRQVATLFNGPAEAAKLYSVEFNASNLPSGIYFYRLQSPERSETRKMALVK